jgi:hypothetical protein
MRLNIRYSSDMRGVSKPIAAIACLCLLTMQMSGLHLHVDEDGHDAGIHTVHLHQVVPEVHTHHGDGDVHDHSAEVDVSLLEQLGASWSKLVPLLIACLISAYLGLRLQQCLRPLSGLPGKVRHRERWRPPLRGPPISL